MVERIGQVSGVEREVVLRQSRAIQLAQVRQRGCGGWGVNVVLQPAAVDSGGERGRGRDGGSGGRRHLAYMGCGEIECGTAETVGMLGSVSLRHADYRMFVSKANRVSERGEAVAERTHVVS